MKLKFNINHIVGSVVKKDERYEVVDNVVLNSLVLSSTRMNPNKSTNGHLHKGQEEIYMFIEGSGKMWLDKKEFEVKVGDVVLIEGGVFHKVEASGEGIYFVCVFNGGRSE